MEERTKSKLGDIVIFVAVFLLTSSVPFSLFVPNPEIVYWLNIALRLAFFPFAFIFIRKHFLPRPAFARPDKRLLFLGPFLLLCFSNYFVAWIQGLPGVNISSPVPLLKDALLFFLVAVGEELVFRAVVFPECKKRGPLWKAVVLSSLIFALPHLLNATSLATLGTSAIQVAYSFALGLVLSISYEVSGNIIWGIAFHFLFDFLNGSLVSALYLLPWDGAFYAINALVFLGLSLYFVLIRSILFKNHAEISLDS